MGLVEHLLGNKTTMGCEVFAMMLTPNRGAAASLRLSSRYQDCVAEGRTEIGLQDSKIPSAGPLSHKTFLPSKNYFLFHIIRKLNLTLRLDTLILRHKNYTSRKTMC